MNTDSSLRSYMIWCQYLQQKDVDVACLLVKQERTNRQRARSRRPDTVVSGEQLSQHDYKHHAEHCKSRSLVAVIFQKKIDCQICEDIILT